MDEPDESQLLKAVKKLGYRVRKPGKFVRLTAYVHENTLKEFRKFAADQDYQIQDAVTEAFDSWLDKKKQETTNKP